jgi:excisionase family DNA binding protein
MSKLINLENSGLISIKEAAKLMAVHQATLRRWDKEGKLKAVRIGQRGHRKYKKNDLEKLMGIYGQKDNR